MFVDYNFFAILNLLEVLLELFSTSFWLGIIGFLLINVPILKMVIQTRKNDKKISVAFMGILVMAFFIDVITTKFFWSAMILISVICSSHREKNN